MMLDSFSFLEKLGILGGAVSAVYGAYKFILKMIRQHRLRVAEKKRAEEERHKRDQEVERMVALIPDLLEEVKHIKSQFARNGGSSIKDHLVRIEHEQIRSRHFNKSIADQIGMYYFEADLTGGWVNVGMKLAELLDCNEWALLGAGWTSRIDQESRESVMNEWHRCIKFGIPFHMKLVMLGCNSEPFDVVLTTDPIRDEQGKLAGYYGMVRCHAKPQ
jgi:hypothetical protein